MVRESDVVIAYVCRGWGGAVRTLRFAKKLEKRLINLRRVDIFLRARVRIAHARLQLRTAVRERKSYEHSGKRTDFRSNGTHP